MKKRLSTIILSFLLCMVLLATTINNTSAQAADKAGVVTLAELGKSEINLDGPFDTSTISFGLPADWKFTGNAQMNLLITTTFISTPQGDTPLAFGGTLAISFNRTTVATLVLNEVGTINYPIEIPVALLASPRTDGLMELKFTLNSGISCVANQRMNVVISAASSTSFIYEEQMPDTALINFPRPIFQSSIFPDLALVVIPDKPTAMELQSAFTIAAGLGNLTANKLGLELITASQLTNAQKSANHLIFVGKASSILALSELALPLKAQKGAFEFSSDGKDNGVIQMINSPWAVRNAVLVVTGNTDLGTLKAAQAVSTGVFQENTSPNLAIVEEIQDAALPAPLVTNQSFADLGYEANQFSNRGIDSQSYSFYIPSGSSLATDSYLELAFGHSALLDYNTSGIVILLNGQPIGSVRFNDGSASQAINRIRVAIPPSVTIPGDNRLEIRANLEPIDNCTDPNLHGLWAVVWPESLLHLPFTTSQLNTQLSLDLTAYPAPMIFDSTLSSTAVLFRQDDLASWQSFTRVASYLGDQSNGSITRLSVFFDDELAGVDLAKYNLIVVGQPSKLAIMGELNAALPVPFETGSDITQGKFLQVTYQIPPEVPVGYVELLPSPWNSEKVLIAALGNTVTGVNWGISALVDSPVRSQLAGDFALINNTRVQTIDTRLVLPIANTPVPQESSTVAPPLAQSQITSFGNRPAWLLPTLVLAIVLIVIIIVIAALANFRSSKKSG